MSRGQEEVNKLDRRGTSLLGEGLPSRYTAGLRLQPWAPRQCHGPAPPSCEDQAPGTPPASKLLPKLMLAWEGA